MVDPDPDSRFEIRVHGDVDAMRCVFDAFSCSQHDLVIYLGPLNGHCTIASDLFGPFFQHWPVSSVESGPTIASCSRV